MKLYGTVFPGDLIVDKFSSNYTSLEVGTVASNNIFEINF